jgi:tripartite-type tricarboxylate transporter receptor subunit TctC
MTLARHALDLTMAAVVAAGSASAKTWPNNSIGTVEPYAPGELADLIARHVAEPLARRLSRSIVVDSKAGAGRMLGTSEVARVPLDARQEKAGSNPAGNSSAEFRARLHIGIGKTKKLFGPRIITLSEQAP